MQDEFQVHVLSLNNRLCTKELSTQLPDNILALWTQNQGPKDEQ